MAIEAASASSTSHMQGWLRPPQRPEQIEQLIMGVERYDPGQVQILEEYLAHQMQSGQYDPLANLATLKLYQFNPDLVPLAAENPAQATDSVHDSVTIKILLLALAHRPFASDFSLALALCGDRMSNLVTPHETLALYSQLSHLSLVIQSRKFVAFWDALRSDDLGAVHPFVAEIDNFDDLVRAAIGDSVEACFRSISKRRLGQYLGLEGAGDLDSWVMDRGWKADREMVFIPANPENSPVATVVRERTSLDDVQRILSKSVA